MILRLTWPLWLTAAVVVPLLTICVVAAVRARRTGEGTGRAWLRRGLMVGAVAVIALGPAVPTSTTTVTSNVELFFVVDRTGSMAAEDYDGDRPRLEGVRHDVTALVDAMPGSRYSVITFDSQAARQLPLTTDSRAVYSWADTLLGVISFLGMTIPRFLLAIIILYLLVFRLNVSEVGMFFSARYGGAPWSWDKFVNLLQHVWPVIFIATFGGLAYNMRVMRGNLLDVLNAQYIETARAKGLPEGAVIMKHAVPNALHPLVAYQGVVLPYMLTGEIEVAIVFGLATVGPAIVGSMGVGDVFVTATFMPTTSSWTTRGR